MTQPHAMARDRRGLRRRRLRQPWPLLAATVALGSRVATVAAHSFPYVPTQILMPGACVDFAACNGRSTAYIFTQGDGGVEFLSLNFSGDVTGDTRPDTVTTELPFLGGGSDDTAAFGAARTGNGTVLVYAGGCGDGRGSLWSYSSSDDGWEERTIDEADEADEADDDNDDAGTRGPFFLGGTLAFSTTLAPTMDQPTLYTYGGMCASPQSDSSSWQWTSNYTQTMMSLQPSNQDPDTGYGLAVASSSGPRTPMAGFTLTKLTPSMTNISGIVTQQAGFVLLGGHTETAFINMSTAAVWNLPAESWTYVGIQSPTEQGTTDLAMNVEKRQLDSVDSRSGHTAVLSEDGASIVVFGGWVGDVDTPAEPQLVVLEMSQAYRGWRWMVPDDQPEDGIYGHGAAVLPGNVMLVYGGWSIGSGSAKLKRQNSPNTPRFLNLTSMSWETSYTNPGLTPDGDEPSTEAPETSDPSDNNGGGDDDEDDDGDGQQTLALGLGLGIGLALLLSVLLAFGCWYWQKKKQRDSRDRAVRALSQDASHFIHDTDEMVERSEFLPWTGGWYTGGSDPYRNGEQSLGFESLRGPRGPRGSSYGNVAPPPPSQRKAAPRHSRGGYMPAGSHAPGFATATGHIHPILEDDEEDPGFTHNTNAHEPGTPTSEAPSDPFLTPTATTAPPFFLPSGGRASSTPSPESPRRHDPEVQDWVSDVDVADAMLSRMGTRHGRVSPTRRQSQLTAALRDDESRSGSNLSDSTRSAADSLRHHGSTRRPNHPPSSSLLGGSTLLGTEHAKPGSSSSSSYNTARSSFGALQAEGPSLLIPRTRQPSPVEDDEEFPTLPGSPSKSKPRRDWLGSLRRVFSVSGSTTPTSSTRDESPRRRSLEYGGDYEAPLVGLSGELLRRKQGRHDWELTSQGGGMTTRQKNQEPETDWDIERAVEQRLVQVVFTVPKERLRVVNAEPDDAASQKEVVFDAEQPMVADVLEPKKEENEQTRDDDASLAHVDSADYRLSMESSHVLMTAQAVTVKTLPRPRSRVLQMVDSIEKSSTESSPERAK
ncbi:hypothetical protein S7711_10628 [Stachybotrys chartarum IBT 7711]|uniref:Galactose oxidase n=1 Tax=Stachybotrys chartarum (strain CBS 109288 / IBT 7711) TaxID=1280523 RepID=A0A084ALZ7_STACB|nr:hypothetical protein S7711_10628 [Stachybotrys chartarum IBT 7711]